MSKRRAQQTPTELDRLKRIQGRYEQKTVCFAYNETA